MILGRRVVAVVVGVVAVSVALPAGEAISAASGNAPHAEAAKKRKCKKGYKRVRVHGKVKCKKKGGGGGGGGGESTPTPPAPADPQTRFLAMLNNSGWDRPWTADTPQHEPFEDLYNFCADSRYYERFTNGMTGLDSAYQGTWQLLGVQTGVVAGYNVVEGHLVTTDQTGAQTQLYVDLSEQAPSVAFINQNEFTRVAAQAC